MRDNLVNR